MPSTEKIDNFSLLIVEDEPKLLTFMVEYLSLFFTHIYQATNSANALNIYQQNKPSIIITDVIMPGINGLDFIQTLRKKDKETPIIVISAYSEREKLLQAIELNLVTYLLKPFLGDELKKIIMDIVEKLNAKKERIYLDEAYTFDLKKVQLLNNNKPVTLKRYELKLLHYLCLHPNTIISAMELYNHIYYDSPDKEYSSYAITSLIKRVRKRLPKHLISTHYNQGYRLNTF